MVLLIDTFYREQSMIVKGPYHRNEHTLRNVLKLSIIKFTKTRIPNRTELPIFIKI